MYRQAGLPFSKECSALDLSNQSSFGKRLIRLREVRGLSRLQVARLLGVGEVTVLRWENGTSKPPDKLRPKLKRLGIARLSQHETKQSSEPRLRGREADSDLREGVRKVVKLAGEQMAFEPSPFVLNGPPDQLPLFEFLYWLQESNASSVPVDQQVKRLSAVAQVAGVTGRPAQFMLEAPRNGALHWNPNYGPHGWHRYVGRFPPHVIRALLNHFGVTKGSTVCDPFAGSGTTLVEARLLGANAIGIEISPLSSLITRAKSQFPSNVEALRSSINKFGPFFSARWGNFADQSLPKRVSGSEILARRGNSISAFPNIERWLIPEALLGLSIAVQFALSLDGYARDLFCCALSSKMRSIGNIDVDVVRAEYSREPRRHVDVRIQVESALKRMFLDIERCLATHEGLISESGDVVVREGSMLDVDLPCSSVDCIVTSPPYGVESLSYLRTHLLSYRCLEPILRQDPYAEPGRLIGSEYVDEQSRPAANWRPAQSSKTFESFFESLLPERLGAALQRRSHMMMHFFDDMVSVAERFARWLRPGGRVAFVIGNKKLGETVVPTATIVQEVFAAAGLIPDSSFCHKLKCSNSNSEVPWQERIIKDEYILLFTKSVG